VSVRDWAREYIARGWRVVPLAQGSKKCKDDGWLRLIFKPEDFHETDNIGIRSVDGLVIIDEDCPEAVACADTFLPHTDAIYGRKSKPRSKRLFLSTFDKTIAYKDVEGGTLIEIRSAHQDMAPPSIHPNGEVLRWEPCSTCELQPTCDKLCQRAAGLAASCDPDILQRGVQLTASCALISRHYAPAGARHEWSLALCGTLRSVGITETEAEKILSRAAKWANDGKLDDRLLEVKTTYAKREDDPVKGAKALKSHSSAEFVAALRKIWGGASAYFVLDDRGEKVIANSLENIRRGLIKLDAIISYDEFADKPLFKMNGHSGLLDDHARRHLWFLFENTLLFRPSTDYFTEAILEIAKENSFHPVRDYLNALRWDGEQRLDTWLIRHARAAKTAYVKAVSRLVLVAACRRVIHPGCKFDELLVLESGQGQNKSSALKILCPCEDWFSDALQLNVGMKEFIEATQGKWIIEASELAGKGRTDSEALKSMLSRQIDGPVRMAYGRMSTERKRQCVIIGTTNHHNYLKDATGNRRFWPVRVEPFNLDALGKERDQLWAEAALCEKRGDSIRLDPHLYGDAQLQQERRRAEDPWEPILQTAFCGERPATRVSFDMIWNALEVPVAQRDVDKNVRVKIIMQMLGFRSITVSQNGIKTRGFGRDDAPAKLDI